jgi:hypothetical protein
MGNFSKSQLNNELTRFSPFELGPDSSENSHRERVLLLLARLAAAINTFVLVRKSGNYFK